jgi:shikimate-5-dehydrogenase
VGEDRGVTTWRRAAVLGLPVAHSLSPVLHSAAYEALGLADWSYDAIECDEAALPAFVEGLDPTWVGLSLTMPLKRAALAVADQASPLALAVGAANTLLMHEEGRRAENTDVAGIVGALREAGVASPVESAVVLGAGGTAQAALAALRDLGQETPVVVVRDVRRTSDLRAAAERLQVRPRVVGGLSDRPLPGAAVVISALPPGAADRLRIGPSALGCVVLDVVYAPWPTPFALSARDLGARVVGGLTMLLHQAAAQVELFTGRPAPLEHMRAALAIAAAARGRVAGAGR